MSNYRRAFVPGGRLFSTVNLLGICPLTGVHQKEPLDDWKTRTAGNGRGENAPGRRFVPDCVWRALRCQRSIHDLVGLLCHVRVFYRFLDAGITNPSTRCGDRRPKTCRGPATSVRVVAGHSRLDRLISIRRERNRLRLASQRQSSGASCDYS